MTKASEERGQHRGFATAFIVLVVGVVIGGIVALCNNDAPNNVQPPPTQSHTTTTLPLTTIVDPGCPELPRSGLAELECLQVRNAITTYCDYQRMDKPPGMDRKPGESVLEAMTRWLARPLTETEKAAALEEAISDLRDYSGILPDQETLMDAMDIWCP